VPFMDTACPDGWSEALDEIGKVPFETLIPGHGPLMSRDDFLAWKGAFNSLIACARSDADMAECIAGWERDAARFIPESHRDYVREALEDYINTRLRSPIEEQERFCKPLGAA
jgi:glyoxylase-like metal-dependent hydrolase (beta-lactamase superfamily II)